MIIFGGMPSDLYFTQASPPITLVLSKTSCIYQGHLLVSSLSLSLMKHSQEFKMLTFLGLFVILDYVCFLQIVLTHTSFLCLFFLQTMGWYHQITTTLTIPKMLKCLKSQKSNFIKRKWSHSKKEWCKGYIRFCLDEDKKSFVDEINDYAAAKLAVFNSLWHMFVVNIK